MTRLSRRALLHAPPALLLAAGTGATRGIAQPAGTLFTLGVAAGDPVPDGFVLWTRLAPDPLAGGGMPDRAVPVRWEVATDEAFRAVVARGQATAVAAEAHSVHAEVAGLRPGAWHWYRFLVDGQVSPVGRARTAPAPDASPERLRLLLASCQNWQHGYFAAWRHAVAEAPDVVCFVGDYIYEYGPISPPPVASRVHHGGECRSLADYRTRYAQYKTDPDLQRAHAAAAWVLTWDDHEVENDYAGDRPGRPGDRDVFLARRAAAYQAFWEHQPLRHAQRPLGPDALVYRRLDFGGLARLHVLDDRQFRSPEACTPFGSSTVGPDCAERTRPDRSMLGAAQERWLEEGLAGSSARWDVIVQQTLFAEFRQMRGDTPHWWTDAWSGYPAARQRLIDAMGRRSAGNRLVLGGDVHCFYATDIKTDFDDPASSNVATEFVGSSISSRGWTNARLGPYLPANPHVRFADAERRGYAVLDLASGRTEVRLRSVADATDPATGVETLRRFVVEAGRAGVQPG